MQHPKVFFDIFDDDELLELMNHLNSIMRLHTFDPCVFALDGLIPILHRRFLVVTSGDG